MEKWYRSSHLILSNKANKNTSQIVKLSYKYEISLWHLDFLFSLFLKHIEAKTLQFHSKSSIQLLNNEASFLKLDTREKQLHKREEEKPLKLIIQFRVGGW